VTGAVRGANFTAGGRELLRIGLGKPATRPGKPSKWPVTSKKRT